MKIKKDKYLATRGGTAKIINVSCADCGKNLFIYQKDGPGWLKRCYLNRILGPSNNFNFDNLPSMSNLICSCGKIIGTPMKYKDGRLAFKLFKGKFKRTLNKKYNLK